MDSGYVVPIEEIGRTKMQKYQQLAFETREKRPGYSVEVVSVIIGCLGGSVKKTGKVMAKLIEDERNEIRTVRTMQQTVLLAVEKIIRKVLRGVGQSE